MAASLALLALLLVTACAMPSRTHPWCAPSCRWDRETHEVRAGVRCYW